MNNDAAETLSSLTTDDVADLSAVASGARTASGERRNLRAQDLGSLTHPSAGGGCI